MRAVLVALAAVVLAAQPDLADLRGLLLVVAVCAIPVACVLAAIGAVGRWL